MQEEFPYDAPQTVILGYTRYRLTVGRETVSIRAMNPERLRVSENPSFIISDLDAVEPGKNYVHLRYPKSFEPVPAELLTKSERITIDDGGGNEIVLSRIKQDSYGTFANGLMFIIAAFWIFWLLNHMAPTLGKRRFLRFNVFTTHNAPVYNFIYFLLSLGYVMFGALALQNNYFLKNFEKYRSQALVWFTLGFFILILFSFHNRWLIFAVRLFRRRKFLIPLGVALILVLMGRFSWLFPAAAAVYMGIVFLWRLRRDLVYEYVNTPSTPLILREVNEKTIAGLKEETNQRMFFGLGRVLYNQGWDYITSADLLLLLSLFFIVMQVFLGGELGVSVAGFFFLPIELGKILLTVYFADWVSRIDKGMRLNVLWIYGLVLIPFLLLIAFLKDFSPLLVFAFVFLYHIIKINKPTVFKITLIALILGTLVVTVTHIRAYALPFTTAPYNYILTGVIGLGLAVFLLRIALGKYRRMLGYKKVIATLLVIILAAGIGAVIWKYDGSIPRVLGDRINSWLNPWQDYHLSYQFVNALWMMKGTGLFGRPAEALEVASHVPLVEQDLSFSLYVSVFGWAGIALIFATLLILCFWVYRLALQMFDSQFRWEVYVLEFLTVIFAAQFVFPALYVVGLLPIMSQPLPFLSYSNNMLLLFTLPFSVLMMVLIKNMETR
jgi:cell division protein FtsW (lipid II flippase)